LAMENMVLELIIFTKEH